MSIVDNSILTLKSVEGIEYVRPPSLDFLKVKDNDNYTEYRVITKKNSKKKKSQELETNSIDELKKKMLECAENLNFEKAAEIRDKIKILEKTEIGINEKI